MHDSVGVGKPTSAENVLQNRARVRRTERASNKHQKEGGGIIDKSVYRFVLRYGKGWASGID